MQVREIMTQPVHTIQPSATAEQAAELMAEFNIGTLPVCDGDHIIGMITDRDIIIRCVAQRQSPTDTIIRTIMTPNPAVAGPTDSVEAAVQLLGERGILRFRWWRIPTSSGSFRQTMSCAPSSGTDSRGG